MKPTPDEVTTGAYHWILQRPDGAGFAATSHDRRQSLESMTLEPEMDLRPMEMALSDQMFGSSFELVGGLNSPAMSEADLLTGRWSGASVQLLAGDWTEATEATLLCEGELGEVGVQEGRVSMAVDVLPAAARRPPCIQTSPECRAILGDRQCRVDMRSRHFRVMVTDVDGSRVIVDETATERFVMGRLRWISGRNCGLEQLIIAVEGARLSLQEASLASIEVGDRAILTEGCDGRRATCSERFRNIVNFRGEPDLPGSEILLRFPGV